MFRFRRFRIIAVVLGLVLVAAACGGGDSTSDTSTTTAPAAGDGGGDSDGGDGSGGDGGGGGEAATTTTTEAELVSGDSGSTWCDRIRDFEASDDDSPIDFNFFGLTPAQFEAQFETNLEVYEEWANSAPSEIADDVDVFLNAFRTIVDKAKELDWNLTAFADDPTFAAAFEDPAFETAGNNIDAYNRDVCGVEFTIVGDQGAGPPTPGGDVGDDPIAIALNAFSLPASLFSDDDIECLREAVGAEFEAGVTPGWVPTTEEITALFAAVEACGIDFG